MLLAELDHQFRIHLLDLGITVKVGPIQDHYDNVPDVSMFSEQVWKQLQLSLMQIAAQIATQNLRCLKNKAVLNEKKNWNDCMICFRSRF